MGSLSGSFSPIMSEHSQLQIVTPPEDFKSGRLSDTAASSALKVMQDDMNKYNMNQTSQQMSQQLTSQMQPQNYQGLQYRSQI
jgi:hypothetical protein